MYKVPALGVRDEPLLQAAASVLPLRSAPLAADTVAQAKVLWAVKTLQFREEAMEKALEEAIPNLQELLNGH